MADRKYIDLTLKRNLLDPTFDGYKLTLDPLPIYRSSVDLELDEAKLTDDQYSYQHVKAFACPNLLHSDVWNENLVFVVDVKWNVHKLTVDKDSSSVTSDVVFEIPDPNNQRLVTGRNNVSIQFTTTDLVVLANGTGTVYILKTGNRSENQQWKVCYSGRPVDKQFVALHSVWRTEGSCCYIEVLCFYVDKNPEAEANVKAPGFVTCLEWITFSSDDGNKYTVSRTRRLESLSSPSYAALLPDGSRVVISTDKPIHFVHDSLKPVTEEPPPTESVHNSDEEVPPAYTWMQNDEELIVEFELPGQVQKSDVYCKLTTKTVELSLISGEQLLVGELFASIRPDACFWVIADKHNKLELLLTKCEENSQWMSVVIGDKKGRLVLDDAQMTEMRERLAQYTSEDFGDTVRQSSFNTQQLEECDSYPEDSSAIWCLDGESHAVVFQINTSSNQWLFNTRSSQSLLPGLCLRHDVDGIVWQPLVDGKELSWDHRATFNAFGYVQASKQQRKFTDCAPDFSYVALCDHIRHIYVYRRPSTISSSLRNRKSGEKVTAISKQQVVALESTENIGGMRVTDDKIFVMVGRTFCVIKVN